jgi:hypothetical protein
MHQTRHEHDGAAADDDPEQGEGRSQALSGERSEGA